MMLWLELKKLIKSRRTLFLFIFTLALNTAGGLYMIYSGSEGELSSVRLSRAFDIYVKDNTEETIVFLDERQYALQNLWFDEEGNFRQPSDEDIKNLTPASGSIGLELKVISDLKEYTQSIANYDEYLAEIQISADEMKESAFARGSDYTLKNIDDVAGKYAGLDAEGVKLHASEGPAFVLKNYLSSFLETVCIIYFAAELFVRDKYEGVLPLIRAAKNSRSRLFMAKAVALCFASVIIHLALFLVNILIARLSLGLDGLDARVQSVSGFYTSPWDISIREAIGINFLARVLGMLCVSLLIAFISSAAGSIAGTVLAVLGVFGTELLLYVFIPFHSPYSLFARVNVFTIIDSSEFLANYYNINILNHPVNDVVCGILTATVLIVSSLIFGANSWNAQSAAETRRPKLLKRHAPVFISARHYEWKKLRAAGKGALCFIVLIALELALNSWFGTFKGEEARWYELYSEGLKGPYSEKTQSAMDSLDKEFEDIYVKTAEYMEMASRGEISPDYARYLIESITPASGQSMGYSKAKNQFEYVKSQISKEHASEYVPVIPYEELFDSSEEILCSIPLFVSLSLTVPLYASIEGRYSMWTLLTSFRVGKRRIIRRKGAVLTAYTTALVLAAYLPRIIMKICAFQPSMLSSPANSLYFFSAWPEIVSILGAMGAVMLIRILGILVYSFGVFAIALRYPNPAMVITLSMIISIIPCVLNLLGYENELLLLYFVTGFY